MNSSSVIGWRPLISSDAVVRFAGKDALAVVHGAYTQVLLRNAFGRAAGSGPGSLYMAIAVF